VRVSRVHKGKRESAHAAAVPVGERAVLRVALGAGAAGGLVEGRVLKGGRERRAEQGRAKSSRERQGRGGASKELVRQVHGEGDRERAGVWSTDGYRL
jgi:hypothetical protein